MDVNLLAISIGNTRTRLGAFVDGKLQWSSVLANDDLGGIGDRVAEGHAYLVEKPDAAVMLASVNPPVAQVVMQAANQRLITPILRVERDAPIPIGRQLDPETIVGEDRLLNAAAAYDQLKQAVVIVDAGTAITIDFVDGAGTFHGGAIGPGAQLMLDSLHQRAALLPQVDFKPPLEAIGHNTVEAMRTAAFHGLRGMVRELVEQYAMQIGAFPMVIATGGDAQTLFGDYELVQRIVPDLTLLGIAVTMKASLNLDEEG
jgi:type III pantothenate kinase